MLKSNVNRGLVRLGFAEFFFGRGKEKLFFTVSVAPGTVNFQSALQRGALRYAFYL